ncbi:MAG: DNA methyltransferase [Ignavibacteriales bacterium]|nr:DNA methyltransferase [Ignavibacteriales bacterium]
MASFTSGNDVDILEAIDRLLEVGRIRTVHSGIRSLKERLSSDSNTILTLGSSNDESPLASIPRDHFLSQLDQIERTKTLPRARYYLDRLKRSLIKVKTRKINDINLNRWKEYKTILTDSLWLLDRRDGTGGHSSWYWGNFIPQIPHQLMMRYTKSGDWVLDAFAGSGTTLLEAQRLKRNCIGIELQSSVAKKVGQTLKGNHAESTGTIVGLEVGDSRTINIKQVLRKYETQSVQLVILHPPYHNIIQFSKSRRDLSNTRTPEDFAEQFGAVVDNVTPALDDGRMLAVVIGDKYEKGEWKPLGFMVMNEVLKRNYKLKSIVVKNFEETMGKRSQKELWRFRALAGGFYLFKHEYIFIFQKG